MALAVDPGDEHFAAAVCACPCLGARSLLLIGANPIRATVAAMAERRPTDRRRTTAEGARVPQDIIEMIQAAGDGRSEDEHLKAICGLYEIPTGQRERYRHYVRRALEEMRARNGAA